MVPPPDGALDQMSQLIYSAVNSVVQIGGLVSNRDGLAAFETGFHHAAYVVVIAALLVAVFITQVDLYPREVIVESFQGTLHYVSDLSDQHLVTVDVMVGMDFDLHGILLFCDSVLLKTQVSLNKNGITRRFINSA